MGIAWVGHVEKGADGKDVYIIDRPGLPYDEMVAAFPPHHNSTKAGMDFERKALIAAILAEAYDEAQLGYPRGRKNVRGFWYERLLYTLRTVMKDDGTQDSIDSTINDVWGDLVESGRVTYVGMNIYSKKSKEYHVAVKESSPYPTSVVLVEKESFFEPLHDLADIYGISFVATGGQNSRCAAMDYVEQLRRIGIDLDQGFTVYSFCDFDPQGWDIPCKFIEHLQIKINSPIRLVRLGVLKEHISESILQYQATPYNPDAKTERAIKGAQTLYDNFIAETGGIFMPGTAIPARVELDMYTGEQIRERIIEALAAHLDGFAYQVEKLKETIAEEFDDAHESALDELMEEWDREQDEDPRSEEIEKELDDLEEEMAERTPEEDSELSDLFARQKAVSQGAATQISKLEARYAREQALLKQKYDGLAQKVHIRAANKLGPLFERTKELENIKQEKTADLRSQKAALRKEQDGIEEGEWIIWDYQRSSYAGDISQWIEDADDVVKRIEQDGGWRSWLEEVRIEEVDLEAAGKEREAIDWEPTRDDERHVKEWLVSTIEESAGW